MEFNVCSFSLFFSPLISSAQTMPWLTFQGGFIAVFKGLIGDCREKLAYLIMSGSLLLWCKAKALLPATSAIIVVLFQLFYSMTFHRKSNSSEYLLHHNSSTSSSSTFSAVF